MKPLGDVDMGRIIKIAAQRAGIKEWEAVHAHALRTSFEEVLRSRMPDILSEKVQEFDQQVVPLFSIPRSV